MKFLFLVLALTANTVNGCSEHYWDWAPEQWIKESKGIYHGVVVSISLNEDSTHDGNSDPLHNAISLRGEKKITFKVFETLKGNSKPLIKATLPECIGGVADFGDTALLFKVDGKWHIKAMSYQETESIPTKILTTLSKIKREY